MTSYAVQPANWNRYDEHGADHTATIDDAYSIAKAWIAMGENEGENMMVWRLGAGDPIAWVPVYAN